MAESDPVSHLEAMAEAAYSAMYDAHNHRDAAVCYGDAKDCFIDAIAAAKRAGDVATAQRLSVRLAHVKAVFRSQFT